MGYIQGDGRDQGTLFPVVLDDFVPADHVCRVIQIVIGIAQSGLYCSAQADAASDSLAFAVSKAFSASSFVRAIFKVQRSSAELAVSRSIEQDCCSPSYGTATVAVV